MNKLPFVLSLPHASSELPPGFRQRLALTDDQVHYAVDLGSDEIFGHLPAMAMVRAAYSRFVVDLNRTPGDRGPKGVVALWDYSDRPVFLQGLEPSPEEVERLIELFHRPYHAALARALAADSVRGLIDCHSLDSEGPAGAPDPGVRRADVVLGNGGDEQGHPVPSRRPTCTRETLMALAEALDGAGFGVALNTPYSGGHIVRHWGPRLLPHGKFAVQIELNKDMYCNQKLTHVIPEKAALVSERMGRVLERFAAQLP